MPQAKPQSSSPDVDGLLRSHSDRLKAIVEKRKRGRTLSKQDLRIIGWEDTIPEQPQTSYDSIAAAAAGLGVSSRILQLAKRSGSPGFRGARVYPLEVLVWLVSRKDENLKLGAGDVLDNEIKRVKLSREQFAAEAERREFIKSSDAAQWATEMVNAFVKVLDGIPGTLAPDIVGCATVADAELRIRSALDQAKATLHASPWQ